MKGGQGWRKGIKAEKHITELPGGREGGGGGGGERLLLHAVRSSPFSQPTKGWIGRAKHDQYQGGRDKGEQEKKNRGNSRLKHDKHRCALCALLTMELIFQYAWLCLLDFLAHFGKEFLDL